MKTFVLNPAKGDGVPGLPHEITEEQAKAQGLDQLLKEAVTNGTYIEKAATKPAKVKESNNGQ